MKRIGAGVALWVIGLILLSAWVARLGTSASIEDFSIVGLLGAVLQIIGIAFLVTGAVQRRKEIKAARADLELRYAPPQAGAATPFSSGPAPTAPAPQPAVAEPHRSTATTNAPAAKSACARCGDAGAAYSCRRCGRHYCKDCLDEFGVHAATALMAHLYGTTPTFGTARTFDDQGRAFCPACYGALLDRATSTGDWHVSDPSEIEPSVYRD